MQVILPKSICEAVWIAGLIYQLLPTYHLCFLNGLWVFVPSYNPNKWLRFDLTACYQPSPYWRGSNCLLKFMKAKDTFLQFQTPRNSGKKKIPTTLFNKQNLEDYCFLLFRLRSFQFIVLTQEIEISFP